MPTGGLWSYVSGYVIIRVTGAGLEGWLNRAIREGIPLWTVQRPLPDTLVLRVRWSDYRRLSRLRVRGVRVRVLGRAGWPVLRHKVRRRRSLVWGGVACALALYAATSVVWFVHVEAPAGIDAAEVRRIAAEAGLRPGQRLARIDAKAVERRLHLSLPQAGWVNLDVRGTRALIQVAARPGWDEEASRFGHMVADRDGLVVQVVALRGEPLVQRGDTVVRGQILISGLLPPGEEGYLRSLEKGQLPYLRADGRVYARVWYEAEGAANRVDVAERPTGRTERFDRVTVADRTVSLGAEDSSFLAYRERQVLRRWSPPFPWLPQVSWETVWREEVEVERRPRDAQEALAEALAQARERIAAQRKPGGELVDERVEVFEDSEGNVRVRVLAEVHENIAVFEPVGVNGSSAEFESTTD